MQKPISWAMNGIFITSLFTLSACRFGNYSESGKNLNPATFKSAELFSTEVKQLEMAAIYEDGTGIMTSDAPLIAVPVSLLATFSNPVYWLVPTDPTKNNQLFADSSLTYSKATIVDDNGHIDPKNAVLSTDVYKFWHNPNCATQIVETQEGDLDRTTPGTVVLPDGSRDQAAGHLKIKITHTQVWDGDCSDDLQELANCYQDGTGCNNTQLETAHQVFDEYVNQTGFLDIKKASQVRGLEYIVHFE